MTEDDDRGDWPAPVIPIRSSVDGVLARVFGPPLEHHAQRFKQVRYRPDPIDEADATHVCRRCGSKWRKSGLSFSLRGTAPVGCNHDLRPILRAVPDEGTDP